MEQLAMIIAVLLGIFHEVKWTWVVNDIFGIAISYVTIARTEVSLNNLEKKMNNLYRIRDIYENLEVTDRRADKSLKLLQAK